MIRPWTQAEDDIIRPLADSTDSYTQLGREGQQWLQSEGYERTQASVERRVKKIRLEKK